MTSVMSAFVTVPEPAITVQVWQNPVGWVFTVTS